LLLRLSSSLLKTKSHLFFPNSHQSIVANKKEKRVAWHINQRKKKERKQARKEMKRKERKNEKEKKQSELSTRFSS